MKEPTGYVFFEGRSPIDGAPIVGVAIVHSDNGKTGDMVQTYILRSDVHPSEAIANGCSRSWLRLGGTSSSPGTREMGSPTSSAT